MTWILGVDQTGATDSKGRPKPLPAALFVPTASGGTLRTNLRLEALRKKPVEAIVGAEAERVLLVVDAVLGLPAELGVDIDTLLEDVRAYRFDGKAFGRVAAARFFARYLPPELRVRRLERSARGHLPERISERLVAANSVFLEHPFQRNVGCGSYRILRDLAQDERWFTVWPHEAPQGRFVVAEGYPSLYWRRVFASRTRRPERIVSYLATHFPSAEAPRTADDADAVALVLGARWALEAGALEATLPPEAACEGWILGLDHGEPTKALS